MLEDTSTVFGAVSTTVVFEVAEPYCGMG